MNRSLVTITPPQPSSRSSRRRANRRQKQQAQSSVAMQPKIEISPVAVSPSRRRNRRRNRNRNGGGQGLNPYLATIMDPDNVRGVKIPDAITLPTGTWTFSLDGVLNLDATNGTGLILVVPAAIVNSAGAAVGYTTVVTSDGVAATPYDLVNVAINPTVATFASRLRPVSGYVKLWSTAPAINVSGTACSFYIPEGTTGTSFLGGALSSFPAFTSLPYNRTNHFAEGGVARWMAGDPSEFDFGDVTFAAGTVALTKNGNNQLSGLSAGFSAMGVAVTGGPLTAIGCRYRVVINYELIPSSDALSFIDREPSPTNPTWLNSVNDFIVKRGSALFAPMVEQALDTIPQLAARVGTNLAAQVYGAAIGNVGPNRPRNRQLEYVPRIY